MRDLSDPAIHPAVKQRLEGVKRAMERHYEDQEAERTGARKKTKYIGSERSEQAKLAAWLDARNILWLHPPNEGQRSAYGHVSMARQGMKAGAPDVLIFSNPHAWDGAAIQGAMGAFYNHPRGVAIELKRVSHRATVSVNQLDWLEKLREQGWLAKVCCGASEAINWLTELGFGK